MAGKFSKDDLHGFQIRSFSNVGYKRTLFDSLPGESIRNKIIYLLICAGLSKKEIAEILNINHSTVWRICKKGFKTASDPTTSTTTIKRKQGFLALSRSKGQILRILKKRKRLGALKRKKWGKGLILCVRLLPYVGELLFGFDFKKLSTLLC